MWFNVMWCHTHTAWRSGFPCHSQSCGVPLVLPAQCSKEHCLWPRLWTWMNEGRQGDGGPVWLLERMGQNSQYILSIGNSPFKWKKAPELIWFLSRLPAELSTSVPDTVLPWRLQRLPREWALLLPIGKPELSPWHLFFIHLLHLSNFSVIFSHPHLLNAFSNLPISVPLCCNHHYHLPGLLRVSQLSFFFPFALISQSTFHLSSRVSFLESKWEHSLPCIKTSVLPWD